MESAAAAGARITNAADFLSYIHERRMVRMEAFIGQHVLQTCCMVWHAWLEG